ncbi:conserved hypothetical protein [Nitratidesulfovibrio vulgaris DP4]|uniref:Uncharacterized protein n=1 Tax=Nitratidesulfovibrio vulgaris (strain DP4) TaxID=391774 RepID=A0A0H3A588_NITV4|nr:conserved hypothetical protein [Nitratidesulfovibrio vulgaris DP4]
MYDNWYGVQRRVPWLHITMAKTRDPIRVAATHHACHIAQMGRIRHNPSEGPAHPLPAGADGVRHLLLRACRNAEVGYD